MQKDLIQLMHNPTLKICFGWAPFDSPESRGLCADNSWISAEKFLNIAYMPDQHIRCIKFLKDVTILVLVAVQMQGLAQ